MFSVQIYYLWELLLNNLLKNIDNFGAILLLENTSVSQQMKQIDMHHHFILNANEEIKVKTQFFFCLFNGPFKSFTLGMYNMRNI